MRYWHITFIEIMAAAYRRLKTPPIVEAVLDFRVRTREPLDGAALASVSAGFKTQFPTARAIRQRELSFDMEEPNSGTARESLRGTRFDNEASDRVAMFAVDGFTFSHVNAYSDWSTLKEDAMAAWSEYSSLAHPQEIVRIGLRYINRFEFSGPIELNDYFTAAPSLPPDLPQIIESFHSRVQFPLSDDLGVGSLTHVLAASMGTADSVIVDIDIYKENTNYDASDMIIWDVLDKFRDQKNRVFFAAVTEKALEKFL